MAFRLAYSSCLLFSEFYQPGPMNLSIGRKRYISEAKNNTERTHIRAVLKGFLLVEASQLAEKHEASSSKGLYYRR